MGWPVHASRVHHGRATRWAGKAATSAHAAATAHHRVHEGARAIVTTRRATPWPSCDTGAPVPSPTRHCWAMQPASACHKGARCGWAAIEATTVQSKRHRQNEAQGETETDGTLLHNTTGTYPHPRLPRRLPLCMCNPQSSGHVRFFLR